MEKIKWDQSISVENELIDKQHMKLFGIANELVEAVNNKTNYAIIAETLSELLKYAGSHFKAEEQLLEERKYPNLQAHKKLHNDFRHQVAMFTKEATLDKNAVQLKLINYISDWILFHTSKSDLEYKDYM